MSKYKVSQQSKSTLVLTLFALAFTLSSLPGLESRMPEEGSSDLSSQIKSCDIDGQIKQDGNAVCPASTKAGVKGEVHVEYVAKTETTQAGYIVTGEFSIKCNSCEGGVNTSTLDRQVDNLSMIQAYLDEEAEKLKTETKENEDRENCITDEDGEKYDQRGRLECLVLKMEGMEEKEARRFYDDKLKGELSELAQSSNPQDAVLAATIAGQLHKQLGVNCASQVAMAQQAQMMAANQPFNPLAAPAPSASSPTDYIKESSCDVMMMANYNGRLMQLGMQMNSPNQQLAAKAAKDIVDLNAGWGSYFTGRGFALNNPMMNQLNMNAGTLLTSMNDFNKTFAENYDAIVKRHSDILGQQQQQQQQAPGVNTNGVDPRLLRGGGPLPENSNGGAPSVTPFPAMNGNNAGMNMGNQQFKIPTGPTTNAPSVLAPKLDAPVGG